MKNINHKKIPMQSSIVRSYIFAPNTANRNRTNRLNWKDGFKQACSQFREETCSHSTGKEMTGGNQRLQQYLVTMMG